MTEAAQETAPKRRRKPKNQNVAVMKGLLDILEERTKLLGQLRTAKITVAQLESQLMSLAQEVEWRSSVLGLTDSTSGPPLNSRPSLFGDTATAHAQAGFGPIDPSKLTQPIFASPTPPSQSQRDGINRSFADLRSLS